MQERAFENDKIEIEWNHQVVEVLGDDANGVTSVRVKSCVDESVREIEARGMFLAIGHTPNTVFLRGQLDMNDEGYIKWTTSFRTFTSVEGVFAAGDVADDYYRQSTSRQIDAARRRWPTHLAHRLKTRELTH